MLSPVTPFPDAAACCLLAAAAAVRARNFGAHLTGAVVLGCLAGLLGPLLREAFLHGAPGASWVVSHMPGWVLIGSLLGIVCLGAFARWQWRVFPVFDALGIALATCAGTMYAISDIGLVGAFTLGLINGLSPGLLRDMSLGDTAMLVERDWYATAAALGSITTMAVFTLLLIGYINDWTAVHAEGVAVGAGVILTSAILLWKHPTAS